MKIGFVLILALMSYPQYDSGVSIFDGYPIPTILGIVVFLFVFDNSNIALPLP